MNYLWSLQPLVLLLLFGGPITTKCVVSARTSSGSAVVQLRRQSQQARPHPWTTLRGGAATTVPTKQQTSKQTAPNHNRQTSLAKPQTAAPNKRSPPKHSRNRGILLVRLTALTLLAAGALHLAIRHRQLWTTWQAKLEDTTVRLLHDWSDQHSPLVARTIYAAALSLWEAAGLSTIPVETAAGAAFGATAAVWSLLGKAVGASLAYAGTGVWVHRRGVSSSSSSSWQQPHPSHTILGSVLQTTASGWKTAWLLRFSCLPELAKNAAARLVPTVAYHQFLLATIGHGGAFTLVWTWLGVDAGQRVAWRRERLYEAAVRYVENAASADHTTELDAAAVQRTASTLVAKALAAPQTTPPLSWQGNAADQMPINAQLRVALAAAFGVGAVVTPLVMAWWMRELQQERRRRRQGERPWTRAVSQTRASVQGATQTAHQSLEAFVQALVQTLQQQWSAVRVAAASRRRRPRSRRPRSTAASKEARRRLQWQFPSSIGAAELWTLVLVAFLLSAVVE